MKHPSQYLREIHFLMKVKGENSFRLNAYVRAAQVLSGKMDLLERAQKGLLIQIPGIGPHLASILTEYLCEQSTRFKDQLESTIPPVLLEWAKLPGIGPQKAWQLQNELGIHTLEELERACQENQLCEKKGFGEKGQEKILKTIEFLKANEGKFLLSEGLLYAENLLNCFKETFPDLRIEPTGALRRKTEVLEKLEFLIEAPFSQQILDQLNQAHLTFSKIIPIQFYWARPEEFGYQWVQTTGSSRHWQVLGSPASLFKASETEFYQALGLPWIPPEARESGEEVELARQGKLNLVSSIRGIFHVHTNWSDGASSLEEVVQAAQQMGFEYIGISDHSVSAFYAQGLHENVLLAQRQVLESIQLRYPHIRIFWGIESDILADGSLDYPSHILEQFDFVIAAIHSRFQMDCSTMTQRILCALRNPYTRFLAHPTGRLLLKRPGYPVDLNMIIEEAASYGVAIELNSDPSRLDFDWRFGKVFRATSTLSSIHPDAHHVTALQNIQYGIAMAKKALLPSSAVLNTRSVQDIQAWLKR